MLVMDIDRRRFQGFSVFRAGQIAELVAHLIVVVPDLLEYHVRRSVADLSPGNMSVLNGDDGAVGVVSDISCTTTSQFGPNCEAMPFAIWLSISRSLASNDLSPPNIHAVSLKSAKSVHLADG